MSKNEISVIVLTALVLAAGVAWFLVQPYFEAQAFNRITGASVGYWDAMFVELRIDCNNYGL